VDSLLRRPANSPAGISGFAVQDANTWDIEESGAEGSDDEGGVALQAHHDMAQNLLNKQAP